MKKLSNGKWMKSGLVLCLVFMMLALSVGTVAAVSGDDDGIIDADEVINDDLFISAEHVIVNGTVNGTLFATGAIVEINGVVNSDVFAAGETLIVSEGAHISGNAFLGGRSVNVDGEIDGSGFAGAYDIVLNENAVIGHNLYVGGFSLRTEPGSVVSMDTNFGAYQGIFEGEVSRDVDGYAGAVEINGSVGRNVTVEVGSSEGNQPVMPPMSFYQYPGMPQTKMPGLRIGESAKIGGVVVYTSDIPQESGIESQPDGGMVYYTPVPSEVQPSEQRQERVNIYPASGVLPVLDWFVHRIRSFVTLLILGALALWLLPVPFNKSVGFARKETLKASGWGLVVVIVGYFGAAIVAGLLLMLVILFAILTLGGLSGSIFSIGFSSLSLIMGVFSLLVFNVSKVVVSYLVGSLIFARLSASENMKKALSLITGLLIYVLLAAIPCLGWLISLIVIIIGVGAMYLCFDEWRLGKSKSNTEGSLSESAVEADVE